MNLRCWLYQQIFSSIVYARKTSLHRGAQKNWSSCCRLCPEESNFSLISLSTPSDDCWLTLVVGIVLDTVDTFGLLDTVAFLLLSSLLICPPPLPTSKMATWWLFWSSMILNFWQWIVQSDFLPAVCWMPAVKSGQAHCPRSCNKSTICGVIYHVFQLKLITICDFSHFL